MFEPLELLEHANVNAQHNSTASTHLRISLRRSAVTCWEAVEMARMSRMVAQVARRGRARVWFRTMLRRSIVFSLIGFCCACSGGEQTSRRVSATPQPSLQQRQRAVCNQISATLTTCTSPDATPAEQQEQRQGLRTQCESSALSAGLVTAFEGCARTPECGAFSSCMDTARKGEVLRRLRARQDAVCERASHIVVKCAESTMPAEEIAKDGEVTDAQRAKLRGDYRLECREKEMSQRQISVMESCLAASDCQSYVKCTDSARPQR